MPQLGSGCARFGSLWDQADFIASLHSRLEKANLFQKNTVGNNRQHLSQVSSAQENNFFFVLECQHLFPSLPLLPSFPELESCLLGPYVLSRGGVSLARVPPDASAGSRGARARGGAASARRGGNQGLLQTSACSKWLFIILIPHAFVTSAL